MTKAFTSQDVVISTIGGAGLATNFGEVSVQVAIDAKVKWYIPSEFGIDYEDPSANIPILGTKLGVVNLLKKNQSRISYTLFTTGAFPEWGLDNGFLGFDINKRTAILYDNGKNLTSGATLPTIAKAVVAVLHNPQAALNKRIYVADVIFTQQQVLELLEKYTNAKWTVKNVNSADVRKETEENVAKGNIGQAFGGYILSFAYGGSSAANFEDKIINKQLGIPTVSLEQIVKEVVEKKNASQ